MTNRRVLPPRSSLRTFVLLLVLACGDEPRVRSADARTISAAPHSVRGVSSPAATTCDSTPTVVCFRDTAFMRYVDPGDPYPVANTNWLWFGAVNDSIEVLGPPRSAVSTNLGQDHDS